MKHTHILKWNKNLYLLENLKDIKLNIKFKKSLKKAYAGKASPKYLSDMQDELIALLRIVL